MVRKPKSTKLISKAVKRDTRLNVFFPYRINGENLLHGKTSFWTFVLLLHESGKKKP